jgi:hypothetical protein
MREKLIELIIDSPGLEVLFCTEEEFAKNADWLIARGVTIPVRCQDCKHWKNEINGCTEDKRFCDIGFYMVHKDGYCSFGERK